MMHIQPSEIGRMTWWEYQAVLWTYNDRHDPEGKNGVEDAPDPDFVARRLASLERSGLKVLH